MFTTLRSLDEKDESGRLAFRDHQIIYSPPQAASVFIPLSDLVVVGEYTTSRGPLIDDYFLVFVTRGGSWYEASFYCAGRDDMLERLGDALGCPISLCLINSTELRSSVLWPPTALGEALFEFTPQVPAGLGGHLKRLVGVKSVNVQLSKAVVRELERA